MENNLTPFEAWQMEKFGNIVGPNSDIVPAKTPFKNRDITNKNERGYLINRALENNYFEKLENPE